LPHIAETQHGRMDHVRGSLQGRAVTEAELTPAIVAPAGNAAVSEQRARVFTADGDCDGAVDARHSLGLSGRAQARGAPFGCRTTRDASQISPALDVPVCERRTGAVVVSRDVHRAVDDASHRCPPLFAVGIDLPVAELPLIVDSPARNGAVREQRTDVRGSRSDFEGRSSDGLPERRRIHRPGPARQFRAMRSDETG
jgi:hypothetical protein